MLEIKINPYLDRVKSLYFFKEMVLEQEVHQSIYYSSAALSGGDHT